MSEYSGSDSDGGDEEKDDILQGVLFGTLGEDGKVDADYLDEDMKATLEGLKQQKFKDDVGLDLAEGGAAGPSGTSANLSSKAADAVDFEDETDMIPDDEAAPVLPSHRQEALPSPLPVPQLPGVVAGAPVGAFLGEEDDYDVADSGARAVAPAAGSPPAAVHAFGNASDDDDSWEEDLAAFASGLPTAAHAGAAAHPALAAPSGPAPAPPGPAVLDLTSPARPPAPLHTSATVPAPPSAVLLTTAMLPPPLPRQVAPMAPATATSPLPMPSAASTMPPPPPPAGPASTPVLPTVPSKQQLQKTLELEELGIPILAASTPGDGMQDDMIQNSELFPSELHQEEADAEDCARQEAAAMRLRQRNERLRAARQAAPGQEGRAAAVLAAASAPVAASGTAAEGLAPEGDLVLDADDTDLVLALTDALRPGDTDSEDEQHMSVEEGSLPDDVGVAGAVAAGERDADDSEAGHGQRQDREQTKKASASADKKQQQQQQQQQQRDGKGRSCPFPSCSIHCQRPEQLHQGPLVLPSQQHALAAALAREQHAYKHDGEACAMSTNESSSGNDDQDSFAVGPSGQDNAQALPIEMLGYVPEACLEAAAMYCWEEDVVFDVLDRGAAGRIKVTPSGRWRGGHGDVSELAMAYGMAYINDGGGRYVGEPSAVRASSCQVQEFEEDAAAGSGEAGPEAADAVTTVPAAQAASADTAAAAAPQMLLPSLRGSLEPLSRPPRHRSRRAKRLQHPQMLRLESQPHAPATATGGRSAVSHRQYFSHLRHDEWLAPLAWDTRDIVPGRQHGSHGLYLDLNDPHAIFTSPNAAALSNAAAVIRVPLAPPELKLGPAMRVDDDMAVELSRFNASNDVHYTIGKPRDKVLGPAFVRHSTFASTLDGWPILLPSPELAAFHRPRAAFHPLACKPKTAVKDASVVSFRSLAGNEYGLRREKAEDLDLSLEAYIAGGQLEKKFTEGRDQPFRLYAAGPGGKTCRLLDPKQSLTAQGLTRSSTVFVVFTQVELLPSRIACAVPVNAVSPRPPGAFSRKPELVLRDGPALLVEYLEETPPLLARPGMGLKLQTYYKRKFDIDEGHHQLSLAPGAGNTAAAAAATPAGTAAEGGSATAATATMTSWRVGNVHALGAAADDESPFLGSIAPGRAQLAAETQMYRAPAAAHDVASTDFMLVRTWQGTMYLRELTGTVLVGQQQPHMRVPIPGTHAVQDYEDARLLAHVSRKLRRKQDRLDKKGSGERATLKVSELQPLFPHLDTSALRDKLVKLCACQPCGGPEGAFPGRPDDGTFQLQEGVALMEEGELRKKLTPDQVCAHESMLAAVTRLQRLGMRHLDSLLVQPPDRLKLAMDQLGGTGPLMAAGCALIGWALSSAPWATTDAFVWSQREPSKGILNVSGPADPTGRGHGLSFTRDDKKVEKPPPGAKKHDGTITGTQSDLRKLSHDDAGKILKDFGMSHELVDSITDRWQRIGIVRDLSSTTPVDGKSSALFALYARHQKVSLAAQLAGFKKEADKVFEQQLAAIAEDRDMAPLPADPVAAAAMAASAAMAQGIKGPPTATKPAQDANTAAEVRAREDEERAAYEQMKQAGLLGDAGGTSASKATMAAAKAAAAVEAGKAGERRLRRTIYYTQADGSRASKELIVTDKSDIALLNLLSSGRETGGFGERRLLPPAGCAHGVAGESLLAAQKRKLQALANRPLKAARAARLSGAEAPKPKAQRMAPRPKVPSAQAIAIAAAAAADANGKRPGSAPPASAFVLGGGDGGATDDEDDGGGDASPPPAPRAPPMRLHQRLEMAGRERITAEPTPQPQSRAASRGLKCKECGKAGHMAGDKACEGYNEDVDEDEATEDEEMFEPEYSPGKEEDEEDEEVVEAAVPTRSGPRRQAPSLSGMGMLMPAPSVTPSVGNPSSGNNLRRSFAQATGSFGGNGGGLSTGNGGGVGPSTSYAGTAAASEVESGLASGYDRGANSYGAASGEAGGIAGTPRGGGDGSSSYVVSDAEMDDQQYNSQVQYNGQAQYMVQPQQQLAPYMQHAALQLPPDASIKEWQGALNKLFSAALQVLKQDKPICDIFNRRVATTVTSDYSLYVDAKDEMWLDKVRDKIKSRRYSSVQQFMGDLQQILRNAEAYSTPPDGRPPGKSGHPAYPEAGHRMVSMVAAELDRLNPEIQHALMGMNGTLEEALAVAALPMAAAEAEPAEWVACDRCQKWRNLTERRAPAALVAMAKAEGSTFHCTQLMGLTCEEESEWADPEWKEGDS